MIHRWRGLTVGLPTSIDKASPSVARAPRQARHLKRAVLGSSEKSYEHTVTSTHYRKRGRPSE
ncbi:hypothetical protein E2C01_072052 [Portunus trituberculatus]|uniref:Uncharacterized protein n=1 Tax=Portunus trituberculatus TaxID=210409 RepID=A0A5B7I649_PORTR|nr:hypothetical protein [Portunus trituberculatus]